MTELIISILAIGFFVGFVAGLYLCKKYSIQAAKQHIAENMNQTTITKNFPVRINGEEIR